MLNKDNYSYNAFKGQVIGFVGVLVFLALTLLLPVKSVTLLFLSVLLVYSVLFPSKALTFLIIYFPARSFFIEMNPSLKIVAEVIIFGSLLHILWKSKKDTRSLFSFHWFEWAFFAFCAVGTISAYLNDVSLMAIITQLRAFLLTYLIFYVMKRLVLKNDDIHLYLWTTFFVASVLSVLGIIEKISDKTWLFPSAWEGFAISPTNGDRVYGLAKNPNVLASFLVIALFTSFYLKSLLVNWKQKLVWVGIILIGTTSVLTYSRGTLLAFLVSFAVYVLWKREWKKVIQLSAALIMSLVVALYVVEPFTKWLDIKSTETVLPVTEVINMDENEGQGENRQKERIEETFSSDTLGQSRSGGRLWILDKGFLVFSDHPIAGSGFATFGDSASLAYGSPIYEQYELRDGIYSDNQYIQVIAQTGVLGAVAFGAFLLAIFFMLLKRRDEPKAVFAMLIFIAIVASSIVYNTWEDKAVTLYIFGLLGIIFSNSTEKLVTPSGIDKEKTVLKKERYKSVSNG